MFLYMHVLFIFILLICLVVYFFVYNYIITNLKKYILLICLSVCILLTTFLQKQHVISIHSEHSTTHLWFLSLFLSFCIFSVIAFFYSHCLFISCFYPLSAVFWCLICMSCVGCHVIGCTKLFFSQSAHHSSLSEAVLLLLTQFLFN